MPRVERLARPAFCALSHGLLICLALLSTQLVAGTAKDEAAGPGSAAGAAPPVAGALLPINDWLLRMHEGSRSRSFSGTFVVTAGSQMSSARIWHVSDGGQQAELVEALTGAPRSVYRHNSEVLTFMPLSKLAVREQRDSLGNFTEFLRGAHTSMAEVYAVRAAGQDRVAGVVVDVIELVPKDRLRYGFRVWVEQKSGLVLKLQTLDVDGRLLEQAAFTELQLDAAVKMGKLLRMMAQTEGYRIESVALKRTPPGENGWTLKAPVPGFKAVSSYQRPPVDPGQTGQAVHWTFSDGLASVSLFMEPFDPKRHGPESHIAMGATQTLTRRLGNVWVTAMGEVPLGTLRRFVSGLERKR